MRFILYVAASTLTIFACIIAGALLGYFFDSVLVAIGAPHAGVDWNRGWWTAWISYPSVRAVWKHFYGHTEVYS